MRQHLSIAHIAVTNIEPDHVNGEVFLKQSCHSSAQIGGDCPPIADRRQEAKTPHDVAAYSVHGEIERQRPDEATKGLSDRAERRLTEIKSWEVLAGSKHL